MKNILFAAILFTAACTSKTPAPESGTGGTGTGGGGGAVADTSKAQKDGTTLIPPTSEPAK